MDTTRWERWNAEHGSELGKAIAAAVELQKQEEDLEELLDKRRKQLAAAKERVERITAWSDPEAIEADWRLIATVKDIIPKIHRQIEQTRAHLSLAESKRDNILQQLEATEVVANRSPDEHNLSNVARMHQMYCKEIRHV